LRLSCATNRINGSATLTRVDDAILRPGNLTARPSMNETFVPPA